MSPLRAIDISSLRSRINLLICGLLLLSPAYISARPSQPTRILIIFDCSGSMRAKLGKTTRMEVAKKILIRLVDSLSKAPELELALRAYGHQYPVPAHNCLDSKLEIPFSANNRNQIIDFVKKVQPNGYTPIAYSLAQAATDFPDTKKRNVILLITDGIEECDGNPCQAVKDLMEKKVYLKPYIVGIGLSMEKMKAFDCVGKYYAPQSEKEIGNVVAGVVSQALDNTTVQVYLNDASGKPSITHAEMTFSDAITGKDMYHYMHTLSAPGTPDTFSLDPNFVYNLTVHTVPALFRKNLPIQTAHHTIIQLPAAQGELKLNCTTTEYRSLPCLIRKSGEKQTLQVQNINATARYLIGSYDIDVLTMPRLSFRAQGIKADELTQINIPEPGKLEITMGREGVATLFYMRNGKQREWLFNLKRITASRDLYILQPGEYRLLYRIGAHTRQEESKEVLINIQSGGFTRQTVE